MLPLDSRREITLYLVLALGIETLFSGTLILPADSSYVVSLVSRFSAVVSLYTPENETLQGADFHAAALFIRGLDARRPHRLLSTPSSLGGASGFSFVCLCCVQM